MPALPIQRPPRLRIGTFEKLEPRNLLATLFYEDFDPLTATNFPTIVGGSIFGKDFPADFHSGDTLYFNGITGRQATTRPIDIGPSTVEFRLRWGDGTNFFERIDEGEGVLLEGSVDNGVTWITIKHFAYDETGYSSADQWNLASFKIPSSLESPSTILRWRQLRFSGPRNDHWAIDEVKVVGENYYFTIEPVSPNPRNSPVESIQVNFSKPIDQATFSFEDLSLTNNNQPISLDNSVTIQAIRGNKYAVNGLSKFTQASGSYSLTLHGASILDSTGKAMVGRQSARWSNEKVAPTLVDVVDVSPDPRAGAGKAVSSIDVVFSEPIDLSSFDYQDLNLRRDGNPVDLINSSVVIQPTPNPVTYRVSNLGGLTALGGRYVFSVDGEFRDLAGNVGNNVRGDSWLANDPPVVVVGGTLVFPEDSRPLAIAGAGLVTDVDSPDFRNGTLSVSIVNPKATDVLSIFNRPASITRIGVSNNQVYYDKRMFGTFTGGVGSNPLIVTLNTRATPEAVQALLRNISYQYAGDVLVQESRTIQIVAEDGEGGRSRTGVMKVLLHPVNDNPVLALNQALPIAYARNAPAVSIAANATISDVDNPDFYNGTLIVQVVSGRNSTEVLGVSGEFSILNRSVRYQGIEIGLLNADGLAGRPLTIRFNEKATQAVVQELLRSIRFSTVQSPTAGLRKIDFLLRDGRGGVSDTASIEMEVQ